MSRSFVVEFLERSKDCRCLDAVCHVLQELMEDMGFVRWAYATWRHVTEEEGQKPLIIHNYPDVWVERYLQENYSTIDPVITKGSMRTAPFRWSNLVRCDRLTNKEKEYYDEASTFDLIDGIGIPILGLAGQSSMFSMASSQNQEELDRLIFEYQHQVIALAFAFHSIASDFNRPKKSSSPPAPKLLSTREKECLLWVMRGKSSWEISNILGTAERTVNFHIENAKRKLAASSRSEAVVKAIIDGHISP